MLNYQITKLNKLDINLVTQFFAEIEFGMLSKNCKNYGICKIHYVDSLKFPTKRAKNDKSAVALVSMSKDNKLECIFFKPSLSKKAIGTYFAKPYFLMEEDFKLILPEPLKVEQKIEYTIKKGHYYISSTIGSYIVNC